MAEGKTENLFGKSAMSRIASADELDHYVKVTNPSAWVVVVAALLLIAGIIIWALVAVVPITVETTGVSKSDRNVICWVDKATAKKIRDNGAKARVGDVDALSVEVSDLPMSSSEVKRFLGSDFIIEALSLEDWNYMVTIETEDSPQRTDFTIRTAVGEAGVVPVSITVLETRPIFIVMGKE